jgi:hypothetical protein
MTERIKQVLNLLVELDSILDDHSFNEVYNLNETMTDTKKIFFELYEGRESNTGELSEDDKHSFIQIENVFNHSNEQIINWIQNKFIKFSNYKSPFTTTCYGCLYDQPNQMAHMDVGGCLYYDF